ncbi:4-hydroxy-3-methylbut-2-enyl diphosphate reductase [Leptospira licerasiae]|uniref:4-hydroxy-3-methylbut-2-enyl diphosphate reductase n=1 Tax=Leptospira licerasiae str. MMD4847 TaxID=1049971 RepID=A0ABN0HBD1_9LEPT|nr:4-hydroxy-3-methylbut-2-enyl diphosphate reductase [Leptospira licerasiae]EIE01558.1 4-hydroxy-3-methylbut-2-enyl diphosphate reductase [Leptospira licerasiae serovar Varillal str. VAR 010]EJZ42806.1 4-hydroxy-3-methylbut-2-enyl diphosphate reductase [Leptospira licerasiae str. MMD4847]TGM86371.1 4-hydroxy-3-methylbut-2-enyl diphosphate reductase [Leptospira licerasiae]
MLEKIYLANPRGFCAGVKYAISYVEQVQSNSEEQIYVRKEIVHNRRVVEDMKKRGIKFINELGEAPDGSTVVFSAHGVSPEVVEEAKRRGMKIGDATCPLVTRVHRKARRYKDSHQIIYIGHQGHDEAIGTMGEAQMFLVESPEDVQKLVGRLDLNKPITYLMQTTLSVADTKLVVEKISELFPSVEHPAKDDICYATTERQEAVSSMMDAIDAMMVIGADNSSNSLRLLQLAQKSKPSSFKISSLEELNKDYIANSEIKILGITAGASTPQILVDEIISKLIQFYPKAVLDLFPDSREDSMSFKLPANLLM